MKEPKYDIALVVGRFQPYHNSHHKLINHALGLGKQVAIALGSAHAAPDTDNPFTPAMREEMIRACFDEKTNERLSFYPVRDYPYHENIWICEIQNIIRNLQEEKFSLSDKEIAQHNIKLAETKVCLTGYEKDASSYYLKIFPQWTYEPFYQNTKESQILSATDIRALYLESVSYKDFTDWEEEVARGLVDKVRKMFGVSAIKDLVPEPVYNFLKEFSRTEDFEYLKKEYAYNTKYKADSKFVGLPFSPTFITTDAVVTCKGHILLVKRGMNPGKGLLSLPGGFLAEGVTIRANAIKELREETRINLPAALLDGLIKDYHYFDHPNRSKRGRVVTHAFYFPINIKIEEGLPLVKGGDDAAEAFWLPISALGQYEDKFFEDHRHIIRHFLEVEK